MFKLSSFSSSTRLQSFLPLLHCTVDNALIKRYPLVHDALAKFLTVSENFMPTVLYGKVCNVR